jgi:hypothetical protein
VIDPKGLGPEHIGRLVRYTALHGETETGNISGWNEQYIFVRYGGSITGKATSPEQLELIEAFHMAFRGYRDGVKIWEELETVPFNEVDQVMPRIAMKHIVAFGDTAPEMLEVEFLDEPDPRERFLRFGSDPSGMVRPIRIEIPDPPTVQ